MTLFLRNGEICRTNALRNEYRCQVEHLCVGFPRKRAIRANSRVKRIAKRDETDDLRNEHVMLFLRNGRTCRTNEFAERMLCGTSDDAEQSVLCGILEETVVSSNSAESVTVFWRNDTEFAGRTSLWNEQRRPAECSPADFLRKRTKLGNTQTTVPTGRLG